MSKKTKQQQLQDLIDLQASDGNWNYDHYMHGLLNGMYIGMSIISGETPEFKDAPEHFINEKKLMDKLHERGVVIEKDSIVEKTLKEK